MPDQEHKQEILKRPGRARPRRSNRYPLRARVIAPLLGALLSACSALPEPPANAALYDFGLAAAVAPATAPPKTAPRPLMLGGVTADGLPVDQQALLYRYAYTDDHQLRAYQRARWSLPVEQLMARELRQQLQDRWAVLTPDYGRTRTRSGDVVPLVLHVNLERFEQVFSDSLRSAGVIELRATVLQGDGGRLLAQRSFRRSVDASSADAPGGARALAEAAQAAAADIEQWLHSIAPSDPRAAAPAGGTRGALASIPARQFPRSLPGGLDGRLDQRA